MKTVTYDRGRIIKAPPEIVACLWSNWEIYDAVLGNKFGIRRVNDTAWEAASYFRPSLTLELRDAGLDAGRFVYTLRATVLGIPSSTVVTLTYERLMSGSTTVHGRFSSDLRGIAHTLEPLVRGRMHRAVDEAIDGGQTSCEAIATSMTSLADKLPKEYVAQIQLYSDTARRLGEGQQLANSVLKPGRPRRRASNNVSDSNKVFIVHGRDERTMKRVARELSECGCTPIILRDQPNIGRTLIEKFEEHADADYAVILLTADDRGGLANEKELRARARQNVVFEWGYFVGRINRERVCALYEEGVELPSDLAGFVYIPLDRGDRWKTELMAELRAVGFRLPSKSSSSNQPASSASI